MSQAAPLALRPVTDAEHSWVAMLLAADPLPDEAEQARLFVELGLTEALDGLPCVIPSFGRIDPAAPDAPIRPVSASVATDAVAPPLPADCGGNPCLALAVDSFSAFERCRKAGFTWFAGNYALHPMPGMAARNVARHALVLQLLTLITHDADTSEIEQVIKHDPQLSYQLLRLVNSVAYMPGQRITSFGHAIVMLGRKPMQRWLQLLLYARPDNSGRSPLLPRAAMRAAFMEALFATGSPELREQAFMVGMFSLLDVMLNEKMAKLLAPLNLPVEVNRALQERGGTLGLALRAVEAGETGLATLAGALSEAGIDVATWTRALIGACHWSVRVSREA
jgi:EAL and modified HD-GYP domain-containing signal transduction protein